MDEQSSLADFEINPDSEPESYECEICGDVFDSSKGKGIHRARSHSEEEIKQVLLAELQDLAAELSKTPSQRDMTQRGGASAKTYQKKFGSWNKALREAGLEVNKEQNIAKSDLIDELLRLADELERTPTSRDMAENGKYASSNYTNKFDSWNDAVREAGLDPTRYRDIPRQKLLSELERLTEELGHTPTAPEMTQHGCFSQNAYWREFGSWNSALKEANIGINREKNISESDLVNELHRLGEELGQTPSAADMDNEGRFSVGTYERQFGSWNEAIKEAGLDLNNRSDIPKLELLNAIQRLADEMGQTPTAVDMEQEGEFGWATYKSTFGSWNTAVRMAGLKPNVRNDIAELDLIKELQRLEDELGHVPGRREMDRDGQFDSTTYMSTFGTWNDALQEAGLTPNAYWDIPESELLEELQRLAEVLDRTPIRDEMESQGKFSYSVYAQRFGSWNDALVEAGLDPNKVINPDHLDHIVRSTWELEVANTLLELDVEYEYESVKIEYGEGRIYTPDFVTGQYVIEVKGAIYANEREKAKAAKSELDNKQYVVIGAKLPADIHIPWEDREAIYDLIQ